MGIYGKAYSTNITDIPCLSSYYKPGLYILFPDGILLINLSVNKIKEFLIKLSSFWFFYRWHPEVSLRYLPFVDEIKKLGKNTSILEIGSGGMGIAPYLKRKITGVDIEFDYPIHPLVEMVKASAVQLPFDSSSFDVVLSVDMLEHLGRDDRRKAIFEMLRVAKKKLLIGTPCGKAAFEQDKELNKYYRKCFSKNFTFLREQLNFGLPEKEEIRDTIQKTARNLKKKISLTIKGNENLTIRWILMRGWVTKNILVDIFFRKIFLLVIPILRLINNEPTYRKLFFVTLKYENSY